MLDIGLSLTSGSGVYRSGASPTPSIPFIYDANTYFWDFIANDNVVDSLGAVTVSKIRERIADKASLQNYNKSLQPLQISGGISFNQLTNRSLGFDSPPLITNGKNGWYFAAVITPTATNSYIMEISRATSTVGSRMQLYFSGSRKIVLKLGSGDSATLTTVFSSAQLTLGQKYAIEVLLDFDADTCTLWINGVQQAITVTGAPWTNFPSSNPQRITIGNSAPGALSFDGIINNIVFQDGVPSSDIRSSISAFQQTRQAA